MGRHAVNITVREIIRIFDAIAVRSEVAVSVVLKRRRCLWPNFNFYFLLCVKLSRRTLFPHQSAVRLKPPASPEQLCDVTEFPVQATQRDGFCFLRTGERIRWGGGCIISISILAGGVEQKRHSSGK